MNNLSNYEEDSAVSIHNKSIVIDLHGHGVKKEIIPLMKQGGLTCVFNNLHYEEVTEGSVEEFESSIYRFDGVAKKAFRDTDEIFKELSENKINIFIINKFDRKIKVNYKINL